MRNLKKMAIAAVLATCYSVQASSAVYVVAHPDDDILLMGPNLVNDIVNGYPTVIIVVTAGDAGNGHGAASPYGLSSGQFNNLNQQYYRTRLNARLNALASWIPESTKTTYRNWTWIDENFGSHAPAVERWFLGNVVAYHLNLPDEPEASATKLTNLYEGRSASLSDIRGINTYTAPQLREVIRQIISRNNRNTPTLVVNYHEYRPGSDHPDHFTVGRFVHHAIEEAPAYACMSQAIYPGYSMTKVDPRPGLLDRQRAGYEILHQTLLQGGNITPISDGPVDTVAHPTWMPTTVYQGSLQRGTMDAFHTKFYGKTDFVGARPNPQPCNF